MDTWQPSLFRSAVCHFDASSAATLMRRLKRGRGRRNAENPQRSTSGRPFEASGSLTGAVKCTMVSTSPLTSDTTDRDCTDEQRTDKDKRK